MRLSLQLFGGQMILHLLANVPIQEKSCKQAQGMSDKQGHHMKMTEVIDRFGNLGKTPVLAQEVVAIYDSAIPR